MTAFSFVYITCPSIGVARTLSKGLLKKKWVACTNLITGVESHYVWKGKLERSKEVLLIAKARKKELSKLMGWVTKNHPYDCPCIATFALEKANAPYLRWLIGAILR